MEDKAYPGPAKENGSGGSGPAESALAAAADLGMDPRMKGSAAFFGLKSPFVVGMADFFDILAALPEGPAQRLVLLPGWKNKKSSDEN